ncbi:hypothetical protein [Corynebacterium tapiri]|uniref:DUF4439 domain-containing protein n=1 Tax=Corynebacterium tapiri TaxID=1448266 RepID=A0A5C4U521_9CORY|nr:hypothetical protein [Corynebacterium tapiri]TNL99269.1 hypothetical protein FHE74_02630 [Corynebacterium tapiri]
MNSVARTRPARALVALALAGTLVSCTALGPKPNQTLLNLARQASADAQTAPHEQSRALRQEHASMLFAEVERLCGFDENGAVPDSCAFDRTASAPSPDPLGAYLAAVKKVPEESRDLVIQQAVDLAAYDDSPLTVESFNNEHDQALARDLLEREYAAIYALEAARAFNGDPSYDKVVAEHENMALALRSVTHNPPAPEAGYVLPENLDAHGIDTNIKDAWRAAASAAESDEGRTWFVRAAGHAISEENE